MRHEVSQRVRNETTKCPHGVACLETGKCGDRPLCEVAYADGHCILTLKSRDYRSCPYCVPFGYVVFCRCPVHSELYRQSGRYEHGTSDVQVAAAAGERSPIAAYNERQERRRAGKAGDTAAG